MVIITMEANVLDHGFIELLDHMGSDSAIADAARVSYKGAKKMMADSNLIRYLMRNKHTSPFEMCELKFHIKLPIFVARQWVRHRTASINEISARYTELPSDFYVPSDVKSQSERNKQGSGGPLKDQGVQTELYDSMCESFRDYSHNLHVGMAREQARIVLPLGTYTEWIWKCDLRNIFHFLSLRLDEHAQWEIREYAKEIYKMVQKLFPVSCAAFDDYILNSVTLSAKEILIMQGKENEMCLGATERMEFKKKKKILNIGLKE